MNWLRIYRNGVTLGVQDFRRFWQSGTVWLMTHIMRVTTSAAMWVLLGRVLGSDDVVRFLLIGQIVIVGVQFTGWTVQAFTWDRMFGGTYAMLVAAPSSLVPVMLGRTTVWLLNGIATSVMTFVILAPLFELHVALLQSVWVLLCLALVCLSSYGFAFCLGSLVNWVPRLRNIAQNAVTISMTAICGVVVPVTFWPDSVQRLALGLPMTHGLQSIRLLLAGGTPGESLPGLGIEFLIGLAWFGLGLLTLDRTTALAQRRGAIELL
ncbi:MAG: ABC transporter permease [Vicinamibacterales bacterium]